MANDYVTFDEACELLGKTDAEVRSLVAEGKLRELRDGNQIYFKKADLNQVAAAEGSSIVDLAAAAEEIGDMPGGDVESFASALSSLKDESSSMGILDESPQAMPEELGLADEPAPAAPAESPSSFKLVQDDEDASPIVELTSDSFPEHLPAAAKSEPAASGPQATELTSEIDLLSDGDDAAAGLSPLGGISPDIELSPAPQAEAAGAAELEVPDFGLSGSSIISLEPDVDEVAPSPAKPAAPAAGAGAKKGISVFDEDELQIDADPMGETRISSGMDELEAVGSGSGLLDITQESDDTSLGAALLDVISPTEAAGETAADESEPEIVSSEAEETVEDSGAVVAVEEHAEEAYAEAPAAVAASAVAAPRMAASVAVAGATPMNITLIIGLVALALTGLATAGQIQGVWPSFLDLVAKDIIHYSVFGGLAVIALGMGIWGILAGRK